MALLLVAREVAVALVVGVEKGSSLLVIPVLTLFVALEVGGFICARVAGAGECIAACTLGGAVLSVIGKAGVVAINFVNGTAETYFVLATDVTVAEAITLASVEVVAAAVVLLGLSVVVCDLHDANSTDFVVDGVSFLGADRFGNTIFVEATLLS